MWPSVPGGYQQSPPTCISSEQCHTSRLDLGFVSYLRNQNNLLFSSCRETLSLNSLLLSAKYTGFSFWQLGQAFFFSRHFSQKSVPHSPCCHGSSATFWHFRHLRASDGLHANWYLWLRTGELAAIDSVFLPSF